MQLDWLVELLGQGGRESAALGQALGNEQLQPVAWLRSAQRVGPNNSDAADAVLGSQLGNGGEFWIQN